MRLKQKDGEGCLDKVEIKRLWELNCKESFNVICVGSLFRQNGMAVVTGGEDAIVRCYNLTPSGSLAAQVPQVTLETKSGPIQTMVIHDMTKFYNNDLIVADSLGSLTVICNQQILSRQNVSPCSINTLQVYHDTAGTSSVVMCNDSGLVSAVLPSSEQWRVDLNSSQSVPVSSVSHLVVTSLLTAELVDQHGRECNYVLVADNAGHIFILNQGVVVMVLTAPAPVTAMCKGRFVAADKLDLSSPGKDAPPLPAVTSKHCHQVALGTQTGAIYLLHSFTITVDEFANAQSKVSNMTTLNRPDSDTDILLCCGQFNHLNAYHDGQLVAEFPTPDWIHTLAVADIDSDGVPEAVVGCLDHSMHAIKILT
ncbi:LOW QUALITY PROTEIN: uncharacterized protein LOC124279337 [Haliotis rubra]|uniref:LOW QUALITY PROTEIN: uncharacterized protein LOC124279337 n=1 Tax=Haliotis rubra TaxID=36100 RepID=UPI001EE62E9D|nr:LOW QUALITY PROTEIN: uncharacterized protein LOC124279337 [Haliotis rubra]